MNGNQVRLRLQKAWAKEQEGLFRQALEIHAHPELSFREFSTSRLLAETLRQNGFAVETNLAGIQTAFRACSRQGAARPAVGFLAEMDALSELGHACGHNLIGVAGLGAGIILRQAFPKLSGSVEVIGCPAEERGGGKIILNRAGVFDHLDLAILVHPADRTEVYKLSLALVEVELDFRGKAAHAAAAPERGINALDAALQTFNGVNSLRGRLSGAARIAGILTEGGKAPNIIPDRARAEFWVRDDRLERALGHAEMVKRIAQASARAIGARVKVRINRQGAYAPFLPNRAAGARLIEIYERLGIKIEQGDEAAALGSTDLGNLSWRVPTLHPTIKVANAMPHTVEFAKACATRPALQAMSQAALAMAELGYRVMTEPALRREMKAELQKNRRAK